MGYALTVWLSFSVAFLLALLRRAARRAPYPGEAAAPEQTREFYPASVREENFAVKAHSVAS
jgi:hypothetical protein